MPQTGQRHATAAYALLPESDKGTSQCDGDSEDFIQHSSTEWTQDPQTTELGSMTSWQVRILCTSFALVLLNIVFLFVAKRGAETESFYTLKLQSQYIGLDKSAAPTRETEITLHPPLLTQINREDPHKIFPDDPHAWFTPLGTVSPDDRHFLITPTISSIAQMRTQDFGLELCTIVVNLPTREELALSGNRSFILGGSMMHGTSINIWLLDTVDVINPRTLSWNTRPSRKRLLGSVELAEGRHATSAEFHCPMHSLQTFEFSCKGECLVDLWQDKTKPFLGIVMVQKPYSLRTKARTPSDPTV